MQSFDTEADVEAGPALVPFGGSGDVEPDHFRIQITQVNPLVLIDVWWTGAFVGYEAVPACERSLVEQAAITPSVGSWASFWRDLDALGVWTWPSVVSASSGPFVGDWAVQMVHRDSVVSSTGSTMCATLNALEGAVSRLLGRPLLPRRRPMRRMRRSTGVFS